MVWIHAQGHEPEWLLRRTRRAFPGAKIIGPPQAQPGWHVTPGAWKPREAAGFWHEMDGPCVLVGATLAPWPVARTHGNDATPSLPPPTQEWHDALRRNGGIFRAGDSLPQVRSLWLNAAAAHALRSHGLQEMAEEALQRGWRVVRHGMLDVCCDARPRLLQVITSLQRGGAERIVLDLHAELPRHGAASCLLTLGSPTRGAFPAPGDAVQLRLPPDPETRAAEVMRMARQCGADAVHAHLVDGDTLARLDPTLPLLVTFHNQQQSWPERIECLHARPNALLLGCSLVVTREIEAAFPRHVARTIWNGIRVPAGAAAVAPRGRPGGLTLVAVANPRPQKRLPLLIDVLAELPPGTRLRIAGEPSSIHPEAQEEVRRCQEKIAAHGLQQSVEWLGAVADVPALLAEADVFVSVSAHEGLSLAQLEALAAGLPVVTTAVGGAAEVAARHPGRMALLPLDVAPADFAQAIRAFPSTPRAPGGLAADFTTPVMTQRHAWLLRAWINRPAMPLSAEAGCGHGLLPASPAPRGLLLATNNFSTGGAQSSARRLLLKLRQMGEHVRAVVLQETPEDPTPGRAALVQAGVPVLALEPVEAQQALLPLLDAMAQDPPEAVAFWNVIPEHKLLLADALAGVRLFDVSPGEMLFASLERCFAQPRPGLPERDAPAYGRRLAGMIVKHAGEVALAERVLQCRVALIPNGVPAREPVPEAPEARWVIGTAARLHPHKRLEDLIEAFRLVQARLPQARLRIAGTADAGQEAYAETLRQSTREMPAEWCGEVQDIAPFHDTLSVFAMISEPSGCPNASLEAMASSLPVVATAVGGAMDQIEEGATGFLTPPRDAAALAAALVRVLEDDALRAGMRAAALRRVKEHFSVELMAERYRRECLGR